MRRFFLGLTIVLTFFTAAYFGYKTAAQSVRLIQEGPNVTPSATPSASQFNALIIQVSHMDVSSPVLQAVWILTYFNSPNQTVLTFNRLYPAPDGGALNSLQQDFKFLSGEPPSRSFYNTLSSSGYNWDGYLMLDDEGRAQVEDWLSSQGLATGEVELPPDQALLETSCSFFAAGRTMAVTENAKFDWSSFDPHFQTDIPFDTLLAKWDGLFDLTRPVRCEVISE